MLEVLRVRTRIQARLLAGVAAPCVEAYLVWLAGRGYSEAGLRRQLYALDRFNAWLARHDLQLCDVSEQVIERFVSGLRRAPSPRCRHGRLSVVASGARGFGQFLWEHRIAVRRPLDIPATPAEKWLCSFDEHLDRVQGLSPGTRARYLRFARRLVCQHFGSKELIWSQLSADDIVQFVCVQAGRLKPSTCRAPVTATRAMLRFLAASGCVHGGLEGAVPTVRQWKLAALPRHLDAEQVQRVLSHCPGDSLVGLRDRTIVLLLARLAVRAGEVARLSLDDLAWRQSHILIRASKSAVERVLPLSHELGTALVEYLRARGHVEGNRALFWCAGPPVHRPLTPATVSGIARRALLRAGVAVARPGAHVFRHTAATQMVRRGATFKQVADVLGHARIETTTIYAKLDIDTLARVALAWPGAER
jgi:site-specific recombinase XerD